MKPLPNFDLHMPSSLEEALVLMSNLEDVKALAGGTDLIPLMKGAECTPKNLVDLNTIPELNYIKEEKGHLNIGGTVTHSQLVQSQAIKRFPALLDSISWIGSPQIRNRGTLAGNILNASPAADSAPPLLVHKAEVVLRSVREERVLQIEDVFEGPKINCLEPYELLTEIKLPLPNEGSSSCYKRIGRRKAFTLSVVSAAVYLQVEEKLCIDARVAFGSVDMTPIRVIELEEMLTDSELDDETIRETCESAKDLVNPITDIRGTAQYRRDMCEVLMRRAIKETMERIGE
ncbi:xanthine dehydrogenase family protein subunit M [Candidatus Bathyarchaeota archaeon]|nr:xanthine dehydrogenase family protein subunit M [Candidatus Bathyarchaeota archaeon]